MKRYLSVLLCLCLLLPLGAKAKGFFTDVFVFGDSLSGTGNLAAFIDVNIPSLPPFPGPQPIGTVGLCNPFDTIFIPPPLPRRGCEGILTRTQCGLRVSLQAHSPWLSLQFLVKT